MQKAPQGALGRSLDIFEIFRTARKPLRRMEPLLARHAAQLRLALQRRTRGAVA